jgi:hypothetical protein
MVPRGPHHRTARQAILWRRHLREGQQSAALLRNFDLSARLFSHGRAEVFFGTARHGKTGQRKGHALTRRAARKTYLHPQSTTVPLNNPSGIVLSGSSRDSVTARVEKQRHRARQFSRSEITFLTGTFPAFLPVIRESSGSLRRTAVSFSCAARRPGPYLHLSFSKK